MGCGRKRKKEGGMGARSCRDECLSVQPRGDEGKEISLVCVPYCYRQFICRCIEVKEKEEAERN